MINEFVDFYNMDRSVFASQVPDYGAWDIDVQPAVPAAGYILSIQQHQGGNAS